MARLSNCEIDRAIGDLAEWHLEQGALRKEFRFKTFSGAVKFINQVADIARASRHHPEIWNSYNRVRLSLTTHDEGGVTEKDVAFAQEVESTRGQASSSREQSS